jgi:hypothetical protein
VQRRKISAILLLSPHHSPRSGCGRRANRPNPARIFA